ncbi:hypothetical protein Tco_1047367, partial [Tanacetum coccineum]
MPVLHSFEESKLKYKDEDDVDIKMMGTKIDEESLEHNLYENGIGSILCHDFSLTLNPPIKPKDSGKAKLNVVEPLTIHTPPSPHVTYFYRNGVDIAKISRKRLKPDKHEHGNGRACKEPGERYQKSKVVNSSQKSMGKSQLDTGKANSSDKDHSGK